MIETLLQPEVQRFIRDHEPDDPARLMLQAGKFSHLPFKAIVQQIQARQKAKAKLPAWYNTASVVFPPVLSMEQCSSEQTARYKASLWQGGHLIDLTGGAGVDTFYMRSSFKRVTYVEKDPYLVALAGHNFRVMGAENIEISESRAEDYLQTISEKADIIYLDPARRGPQDRKVITLSGYTPNILVILDTLLKKAARVIVKTSPMLDTAQAVSELSFVQQLHVVAVNNEVKEALYILAQTPEEDPEITAVNIQANGIRQRFTFTRKQEEAEQVAFSLPSAYLYEPNKAILKAGAFKSIASAYGLSKLHPNSHLYTSGKLLVDFPGRTFTIKGIAPYKRKALWEWLPERKASITVRNFPDSVQQVRKKTGLAEGGDAYVFATTDLEGKHIVVVAKKLPV